MDPTNWTENELLRIGNATELQIASLRPDGTLRPYTTIWVVRANDDIYVRSAHGWTNNWFQRALKSRHGHVRAGGVERDVSFEQPSSDVAEAVSRAYQTKYARYGASIVSSVVSDEAVRSTLRVTPANGGDTQRRASS